MSRPSKKERERFYVERAAECLGRRWCLDTDWKENPDFIITEGTQQFGLEVGYIFAGKQNRYGSLKKKKESESQMDVNVLRCEYESKKKIPLSVRFLGDLCAENMAMICRDLVAMDLATQPIGHQEIIEAGSGRARLRVYVTRALRADWFSVSDRVGWVDRDPADRIADQIRKKSKKLPQYKECSGLDDIRLLIVANRIMNSGKLLLEKPSTLDLMGFHVVYFFPYPEQVTIFGCADNAVRG